MYKYKNNSKIFFLSTILVLFLTSCVVTKKSVYFNDLPLDSAEVVKLAQFNEPTIQSDDILSITIQTVDIDATAAVNQVSTVPAVGASSASTVGNQVIRGFLVDKDGNVAIPMLGNIKLAGLTTYQARQLITENASKFFKEPTVQVRFANFKITVIGEVERPATYTVPNEKITLLDAIGLAGDLTIYGKRENVMLIRDNGDGEKEFIRFNLNSYDTFKSPYFYLQQNDVIYVEPGKGKVAANNAARTQTISIISAIASLAIVALSRL
ncbi:polysaccharide biosynthesis/export family protein [Albibacterium sp.]|uniref:polysaccharide biosynthesis/export family protein n=1 Tax=Albibacterium sp. TaxID=2952885 RepID=UPI002C5BD84E|nr:polysaccharide biosynthesis/export family protein [Albibacterium sp.]HUH18907.1 polysaccharide biosynthesis/export family protein [Albibacterium sp.]